MRSAPVPAVQPPGPGQARPPAAHRLPVRVVPRSPFGAWLRDRYIPIRTVPTARLSCSSRPRARLSLTTPQSRCCCCHCYHPEQRAPPLLSTIHLRGSSDVQRQSRARGSPEAEQSLSLSLPFPLITNPSQQSLIHLVLVPPQTPPLFRYSTGLDRTSALRIIRPDRISRDFPRKPP